MSGWVTIGTSSATTVYVMGDGVMGGGVEEYGCKER